MNQAPSKTSPTYLRLVSLTNVDLIPSFITYVRKMVMNFTRFLKKDRGIQKLPSDEIQLSHAPSGREV